MLARTPRTLVTPSAWRIIARAHSSHAAPPSFAPSGVTSADTEIPYGDPACASSAYLPQKDGARTQTEEEKRAVSETPELTPEQRDVLEKIIRVDQAGELGANYIYYGQKAVFAAGSDKRTTGIVQAMWDGEKKHIAAFDKLITQHNVRPTALYPVWKAMAFGLGAGTALMGKRAAMACTEAVETVIGEHYNEQLKQLKADFPDHPSIPLLEKILTEFRDDELEHLDTAVANESQQAPAYALLSAVIAGGCRWAIKTTEKI
ncbi:COQ7 protein [Rhodotorula toruloides ATCC 204091]|uniref:5-demethoxyubiquinone hydroxylase, mitochondrial n=1 Tax=Rhodotorula toruloides TaxID=5286 RepID=A0A0K3CIW6_RHOTO|nr:COQ7 protein [Rhodotorula toruloides ATCC 204091]PRQ73284.1 COQ7 protein [Rhodotorula toruloides]